MARPTLAEIHIGNYEDFALFRIIPNHDTPGLFDVVKADMRELEKAKKNYEPFLWERPEDIEGLTPEQLGKYVAEQVVLYRAKLPVAPDWNPGTPEIANNA